MSDAEIGIDGFTVYRKDRSETKNAKGGGVLLYVHSSLTCSECLDLNRYKCESVWVKIHTGSSSDFIVGCVYRSPAALKEENDQLFDLIHYASSQQALIIGDFNYPGIYWVNLDSDPAC